MAVQQTPLWHSFCFLRNRFCITIESDAEGMIRRASVSVITACHDRVQIGSAIPGRRAFKEVMSNSFHGRVIDNGDGVIFLEETR
jgi:hypothetical protein